MAGTVIRGSAHVRLLKGGTSLTVLSVALLAMGVTPAIAQDQTAADPTTAQGPTQAGIPAQGAAAADTAGDETDENGAVIIVTGTRQALKTSQSIKQNADTFVDSITATDIGAFPDKSVAESLQRVPGITVNRFAASDDTSHFSADPSGVLVRGLTQVRSEYNGRDIFSANSSRGLTWSDIAPELMAGIDVYKNQTAELIEGGIAGLINLRTRVPFDSKGQVFEITANANYGDIAKKFTPEVSAIYSNRWDTSAGEFGILADIAYSELQSESQGIVYGRTAVFDGAVYSGPGDRKYIPSSVGYRDTVYDRTRKGIALAAQWRDPTGNIQATAQYNRSQYHETWREHGVISYLTDLFSFPADFVFSPGHPRIPHPAPGTEDFTFDSNGNFQSGTLVNQQTDFSWWGASDAEAAQIALNDQGVNMLHPCYSWGPGPAGECGADARGPDLNAVTRYNNTRRMTQDASFNLKWKASDKLDLSFDGQYVGSTVRQYDVEVGQYSFANVALDASHGTPTITLLPPTNINQSAGGLSNPNNYRYNHAMDHVEDDDGHELAFRVDGTYHFDSDWLDSLKVGARYADREQNVRYSAYNWGNIANDWNLGNQQYRYWNIDNHAPSGPFNGYPEGLYEVLPFNGLSGASEFVFFDMDQLAHHGADQLSYSNLGVGQDQWEPICSNGGTAHTGPRTGETAGTCFRPDELNKVSEVTKAAYAELTFGGRGQGFSGNIGVRYVETRDKVTGSTVYPSAYSPDTLACTPNSTPGATVPYSIGCYLVGDPALNLPGSPDVLAFVNGGSAQTTVSTTHRNWLPSFNIRIDLSPKWLIRFAASRALSRPDIGYLKNYTTVSQQLPGADASDPRYIKDSTGRVIGVKPLYQASGYNARLKPATATQFDLSIENYFAAVGSFSAGIFYKKFQNYIQYASHFEDFTNNGVTNSIEVRGPENGKGGSVYGVEMAYQRYFDFLPGFLSGFGVQANATYVKNDGIKNSGLKAQSGTDGGSQAQPGSSGTTLNVNSLEGLSKYTYNLVGMYEKYGLAVRVAYNWRSKFLMTAVDCCTYLPTWQQASGFLDASIRYAINNHIELSVQASNILNTTTKLQEQVTNASDGVVLTPNAWFKNDRRFVFGARAKF